ncbi:MAG TPA: pseudouridine synthase [Candidatus Saccharimonadales bacterium]|nr:pseudouridine synthase [Candidatus Saccharimonadales bacterium]
MRLNKYIAQATGISRRAADALITNRRVRVNGQVASVGTNVEGSDSVKLDGKTVQQPEKTFVTIILNKPAGYVSSRRGQGSKTVYDLLPAKYHILKTVGRLDKDSSGLLVLTNDGQLAHRLTHPRYQKTKQYEVALNRPLTAEDQSKIERGVLLNDGLSALALQTIGKGRRTWHISMQEGRNRQIRRTFDALGYSVTTLHRTDFGPYSLDLLPAGEQYREVAGV